MHILTSRARFSLAGELTLVNHLASGTLQVASDRLGLSFREFRVHGDLRARARVRDWQWERGILALDDARVEVTHVTVQKSDSSSWPAGLADRALSPSTGLALSLNRISLSARSRHFSFSDPLSELELRATVASARIHDSAILNAFLPAGAPYAIRAQDGGLSSELQAEIRAHVLDGTVAVRAQRMGIGGREFWVGGDIELLARVSDWNFAAHSMTVEGARLVLSNVVGGVRGHPGKDFDAAPAPSDALGKVDFHAERVELQANTPRLDLVTPSSGRLEAHVAIVGAALPDATVFQRFLPETSILSIESGRARASADLDVSSAKHTARGTLEVNLAQTGIRINQTHLVGDFDLSARLVGYDPDRDRFDISGSRIAMRNVTVTQASTNALQWEGDAMFKEATFQMAPQPELDGRFDVEALDANPILAVLLGNGIPRIFVGLTRMPHLAAAGRLTMGATRLALRDLDAHGGDISVEGTYVLGRGHRSGAFVVGKGPLSAGFRLDDGGAHLRLFGLRGWLREQTRASLRLLDEVPQPSVTASPPGGP